MKNIIILYFYLGVCVKLLDADSNVSGASMVTDQGSGDQEGNSHASQDPEYPDEPNENFPNAAKITHTLDAATLGGIVVTDLFPEVVIYNLLGDLGKFTSKSVLKIFEEMADIATDLFIEYKLLQSQFLAEITKIVDSVKTDDEIVDRLLEAGTKDNTELENGNEDAKIFNGKATKCFETARKTIAPQSTFIIGGIRMLSHVIGVMMEELNANSDTNTNTNSQQERSPKFKFYESRLKSLVEAMKVDNTRVKEAKDVNAAKEKFIECVNTAKSALEASLQKLLQAYDSTKSKH